VPLYSGNDSNHEGIAINTEFSSPIAKPAVGIESVHVDGCVDGPDAIGWKSEPLNSFLPGKLRDNNQPIGVAM
jgi:hypothetical protein